MVDFILGIDYGLLKDILPVSIKLVAFMILLLFVSDVAFKLRISFTAYVVITILDLISTTITAYLSLMTFFTLVPDVK